MAITDQMQRELAKLARAANRRLERASKGQRSALDYYLKNYHTRAGARGTVFQQGKAATEAEYKARMAELRAFMGGKTSTRTGWEKLKAENIRQGAETLRSERKYDLTDEEFAAIIEETGGKKELGKVEFYRVLNNVQAKHNEERAKAEASKDPFTGLTDKEISDAVAMRNTSWEATLSVLKNL